MSQLPLDPHEPPPELDFCARCREHAHFVWDEEEGFLSECCSAQAIPVDVDLED